MGPADALDDRAVTVTLSLHAATCGILLAPRPG